ncbi:MAG: ABC transporter substrate-binding protein [Campylobacterota bacterium]|nr:ABC transporter substrate-binding protein [Campylobacterota bacterium]
MIKFSLILIVALLLTSCSDKKEKFRNKKSVEVALVDVDKKLNYQQDAIKGFEYANKKYRYLDDGTEIKYKVYSHIKDVNSTLEQFKRIKEDGNKVIISLANSEKTVNDIESINAIKLPYISVVGTYDELILKSKYITRVSTSNEKIGNIAAYYIMDELRGKNVAVIYNSKNIYSKSIYEAFIAKFTKLNGTIKRAVDIDSEKLNRDMFKEYKIVFIALNSQNKYKYIKKIKEIDADIKIITTEGLFNYMLSSKSKEISAVDDVVTIEQFKVFESSTIFKLFDEELFTNSVYSLLGYESYILLRTALNKCPELKTECININLRNSCNIVGAIESLKTISGHTQRTLFINTIKDGTIINNLIVH